MSFYFTAEQIDQIASSDDLVLRNLKITQCYGELSSLFAKRMGSFANWCTFATWASKQAGQTIRKEDLERTIIAFLGNEQEIEDALSLIAALAKRAGAQQSLLQLKTTFLGIALTSTVNRASDAISRGNKKVFEEIAREFAIFGAVCLNDTSFSQSNIDVFCEHLKTGPPPGGQDYLRKAFGYYYKAFFEEDAKKKTELNLLANLQIGFHEQIRLQPEIAEALNASAPDAEEVKSRLISYLFSNSGFSTRIRLFFQRLFGKTALDNAIESLLERMQHHVRMILTAHLMTLTLPPDNRLHLGKDLVLQFPDDLNQLANPDLLALLTQIDPTTNSVLKSGATDWSDLNERMHFIADLFRCYHESKELLETPFSSAQTEAIKNSKLPGGNL